MICPLCEQIIEDDEALYQTIVKILIDSGLHNMATTRYRKFELSGRLSFLNKLNSLMEVKE